MLVWSHFTFSSKGLCDSITRESVIIKVSQIMLHSWQYVQLCSVSSLIFYSVSERSATISRLGTARSKDRWEVADHSKSMFHANISDVLCQRIHFIFHVFAFTEILQRSQSSFSVIDFRFYRFCRFYRMTRDLKNSSSKLLPLLGSEPRNLWLSCPACYYLS